MPNQDSIISQYSELTNRISTVWTLTTTFLVLLAFKLEQLLVLATDAASPKSLLESVGFPLELGIYLLSPFLHSSGGHVATNLFWFVLFGAILEQRADLRDYIGFVLGVGIVSNFAAPFLVQLLGFSVGFAIGISGVTNALGMRETIYRAWILTDKGRSTRVDWVIFLVAITASVLSAFIILRGETQPGNSVIAHSTGLVFGAVFAVNEVEAFAKSYSWLQDHYADFYR
jgi:membrane associated rhomboid family serine protease